jgi:O-antigen/teichoic acid export membrane protein
MFERSVNRWLLRGSAFTLLGRIVFAGSVVLQNAILARLLTPERMGGYLLTQSVLVPAMLVSLFGTDLLAIRWNGATTNRAERTAVLRSCAIVVGIGSLICAIVAVAGLVVLARFGSTWVVMAGWRWLLVPLIVLVSFQTLLSAFFRGLGQIGMATLLNGVLSSLLMLGFCGMAYWQKNDSIYDIIVLQIVSLIVPAIIGLIVLTPHAVEAATTQVKRSTRARILDIGRLGPRVMLTQVLALIATQSDIWIVGSFGSPDSVAGYGMASRLSQLVSMPLFVICGVLPPLMASSIAEQQQRRLERVISQAMAVALALALGLALIYIVVGNSILGLLFGRHYEPWWDVLAVLAIGNLVNVAAGPCSQMLIMAGRENTLINLTLVTCAISCGGAAISARMFGPTGIAVAFAVGLSLQGILGSWLSLRLTGVRTYPHLASLR